MADYEILRQPTSVWEFENPTLQANQLGVCSDLRDGIETDSLLSKLGNGVDNWDTLPAYNPGGYKVYRALLTQTGTNAPVATVLENSLGGTVVWTYAGAGSYVGTLVSAFPATKTLATSQVEFADTAIITFTRSGDNTIAVGAAGDDMLVAFGIQILVYP